MRGIPKLKSRLSLQAQPMFCHPHGLEKKFLHNAFPKHLREEKTTSSLLKN